MNIILLCLLPLGLFWFRFLMLKNKNRTQIKQKIFVSRGQITQNIQSNLKFAIVTQRKIKQAYSN